MSERYPFDTLSLGAGLLGIGPLPGVNGDLPGDLEQIGDFAPALVISMTETDEMEALGAAELPKALERVGIGWAHFPIADFDIPDVDAIARWPDIAARAREILDRGGKVLMHCRGGLGRSGMMALRLMIETGEPPEAALERLRCARPGAVETGDQLRWATQGIEARTIKGGRIEMRGEKNA